MKVRCPIRYRFGPDEEIYGRIQAGVACQPDDLMERVGNYWVPLVPGGTGAFAANFVGALKLPYRTGLETADCDATVYSRAVMEYPLDTPATQEYPTGTLVGAGGRQSITLTNPVPATADAIGKLARRVKPGDTTGFVFIQGLVPTGGVIE